MKGQIFKTEIGGREVSVQVGAYAQQAGGSCLIRCGDTVVLINATASSKPRDGIDFFPLSVDYEEKMYAIGKIPGGFKKREGRPSDKAILTSRLIDRPLRPLFPEGFFNDVTVVATALSVDCDISPEVFAMIGSSIALSISDIPFKGPTGSAFVGLIDGKYILNPNTEQRAKSKLNLVVSGTKDAIMMVEAGASEISEGEMLGGIEFAHTEIKKQVAFIEKIVKTLKVKKGEYPIVTIDAALEKEVAKFADKIIDKAINTFDRSTLTQNKKDASNQILEHFISEKQKGKYEGREKEIGAITYNVIKDKIRERILKGIRPDGRKADEVREIWCEVSLLPRVHGSAIFTRGQTQSLTTTTLGMLSESQRLESLDEEDSKRYMHNYNFPGYSVGEARPMRSPGRREIGHGALAERSLEAVLPSAEEFPYAIRTVTEILSSNGSTSMASVCGSTLSLMDAGVPIKSPVAGIAMGLVFDNPKKVAILSDIQGLEDFLGDMDLKVSGTKRGITAIQMDIKLTGISSEILKKAMAQALAGRLYILNEMLKTLPEVRKELSPHAPKIVGFEISPDKIRDVIGSGGKVINKIIDETGVKIDISDDGRVNIASQDTAAIKKAKDWILSIAIDPLVGDKVKGRISRILQFGAVVEFGTRSGMIHISKLARERVNNVEDIVKIGDNVEVEIIKIGEKGIDFRLLKKL
ncbi:MAG: polyribonucleotide nucleotidyltransferase [Firmicutes bacterium]|nr:polyribonucleotide nucleotidyltransferase [Bacillota bacterium]